MDTSVSVKGLFYGGGMDQLIAQGIGSGAVVVATLAVALVPMYAVKATGTLRVSHEGELAGLDIHEHGRVRRPRVRLGPTHDANGHGVGEARAAVGLGAIMRSTDGEL